MAEVPICGMPVDESSPLRAARDGQTFYSCSYHCRRTFVARTGPVKRVVRRAVRAAGPDSQSWVRICSGMVQLESGANKPKALDLISKEARNDDDR
jgi:YHS domain-containing protein